MPIDPRQVQWDETPQIDPAKVQWDDNGGGFLDAVKRDLKGIPGRAGDLLAGGVKGASNIGATLLTPVDAAARALGIQNDFIGRDDRRQAVTQALAGMGADPNSTQFKAGEILTEVAGTAGVPGALAKGVGAVAGSSPLATAIVSGLQSGGFSVPGLSTIPEWLVRAGTGYASGAATAGLVDPSQFNKGGIIGAVAPGAVKIAGAAGEKLADLGERGSRRLMQSAIKPTLAQLKSGDAATAADVLLERGLSPNAKGVEKLVAAIDDADNQIGQRIAGSTATIDKQAVVDRLNQTRGQFANQVSPTADLRAIQSVADDFLSHPQIPLPQTAIPVQQAQELKRGTYQVLGKKYGEMKGAETEAQKALARGLKEEIATAVPGVGDLNTELGRLLVAKDVAERRALMESNKNLAGLAALSPTKAGLLTFLADRSAGAKALAARGLLGVAPAGQRVGLLNDALLDPTVRAGLLAAYETSP